ncbi:MAG: hypothetical protein HY814_11890, partial [Candidatus Riflebacteria bacterium]|nr:hypothetical protein [Candidatus Riflebacteria bacterium]
KTRVRKVVTLAEGTFEAREVLKGCGAGSPCRMVGSEALARLVPPRQRFGYDLIVHVGLARYLGNRQRCEIGAELEMRYGVSLSEGSISHLCDRFLAALETLHLTREPYLRAAMDSGYPMHIDATCDEGKGGLFITLDGWRNWVLVAGRIPSENAVYLRPVVEQTVALFGDPVATVHDLGEAGANAVRPLRERGVPDFVCHYHFLGAVGDKLFDAPYARLRNLLRGMRLRTRLRELLRDLRRYHNPDAADLRFSPGVLREDLMALVFWMLEGEGGKTLAFPFGLPHLDFVHRCRNALQRLEHWVPCPRSQPEWRAVRCLEGLVARLDRDTRVPQTIKELDHAWQAFDELRVTLRLTDADLPGADAGHRPIENPALQAQRLAAIERAVDAYRDDLRRNVAASAAPGCGRSPHDLVLDYLDRYRPHLFGHPVVCDEAGQIVAVVQRTNNPAEHFFGRAKQGLRRRLGRAHRGRDLQQQPAQAAYAANLRHPDYVRLLCGSLDNLPAAFAALDIQAIDEHRLVRDHRDSALIRRARALLNGDQDSDAGLDATASSSPLQTAAADRSATAP